MINTIFELNQKEICSISGGSISNQTDDIANISDTNAANQAWISNIPSKYIWHGIIEPMITITCFYLIGWFAYKTYVITNPKIKTD